MKKILQLLIVTFIICPGYLSFAGEQFRPGTTDEKTVLICDRSIYIAGEKIQLYVALISKVETADSLKSEVIYCELITPDGNKIATGKYRVNEYSAKGCMQIPSDVRTGTYYLRAYTKMMRNFGPGSYAYLQIRIINPKREDVLSAESNPSSKGPKMIVARPGTLENMVTVVADKPGYKPNDTVILSLHASGNQISNLLSLCLKIVPENAGSESLIISQNIVQPSDNEYYAETRGLSLNGKLTLASSTIPMGGKRVNLSIIGEGRDFMATHTDSTGQFFFALPDYYGKRDLFLCAEKTPSTEMKIWVDNDFCTRPVNLPSPDFTLTSQERKVVLGMAVNTQISTRFAAEMKEKPQNEISTNAAFYGKPSTVLNLDQYIQLPTLEECFNELPSTVRVRKHSGEKYFKVMGARDLSFYEPLVLIDWVAVDEPEKILAISPNAVSRIEIINEAYVKGGQTYGGIISIISKRGDFAGIDLPSTGIFVNYSFLDATPCNSDGYAGLPGFPDTRNTMLWAPGIRVKEMGTGSFIFVVPSTTGKYSLVLEGISKSGELLIMEKPIVVAD